MTGSVGSRGQCSESHELPAPITPACPPLRGTHRLRASKFAASCFEPSIDADAPTPSGVPPIPPRPAAGLGRDLESRSPMPSCGVPPPRSPSGPAELPLSRPPALSLPRRSGGGELWPSAAFASVICMAAFSRRLQRGGDVR